MVILNCAKNDSILQAFEAANAVEIIISYIKCPIFDICILGKIILSLFKPYHLRHEQFVYLELDSEEAAYLVTLFSDAIESPLFSSEGYSLDEILQFLVNFTRPCSIKVEEEEHLEVSEEVKKAAQPSQFSLDYAESLKKLSFNNIELVIKSGILSPIEKFLGKNEANLLTIESCLHLLCNVLHLNVALQVLSSLHGNLVNILQQSSACSEAVLCVQWLLGNVDKNGKFKIMYKASLQLAELLQWC